MSQLIHIDKDYQTWISELVEIFRQGQVKAVVHVNRELLLFYWRVGRDISELNFEQKYGKGIMRTVSEDLQAELPGIKGLTERNIYYCKEWYSIYNQLFAKLPQPMAKSLDAYLSSSDANNGDGARFRLYRT